MAGSYRRDAVHARVTAAVERRCDRASRKEGSVRVACASFPFLRLCSLRDSDQTGVELRRCQRRSEAEVSRSTEEGILLQRRRASSNVFYAESAQGEKVQRRFREGSEKDRRRSATLVASVAPGQVLSVLQHLPAPQPAERCRRQQSAYCFYSTHADCSLTVTRVAGRPASASTSSTSKCWTYMPRIAAR
eukprot:6212752-Pleurochrysis_carterae.AAC.1